MKLETAGNSVAACARPVVRMLRRGLSITASPLGSPRSFPNLPTTKGSHWD